MTYAALDAFVLLPLFSQLSENMPEMGMADDALGKGEVMTNNSGWQCASARSLHCASTIPLQCASVWSLQSDESE